MDMLRLFETYGYPAIFFGLLLEYMGLPIPGELILLFSGALVSWGGLGLWAVLTTALAAVLLGDHFWYLAGRRGGKKWLRWFCHATLGSAQCMSRTQYFFQKYGPASLLFAKFLPGFRTFATPLAGMVGIGYRRFLFFDALGSLLWLASMAALGIFMAGQLGLTLSRIQRLGGTLLLIFVLATVIVLILRVKKRLKYGDPLAEATTAAR